MPYRQTKLICHFDLYNIYHMYLDTQAGADSVDLDKTLQNVAPYLHCLPFI